MPKFQQIVDNMKLNQQLFKAAHNARDPYAFDDEEEEEAVMYFSPKERVILFFSSNTMSLLMLVCVLFR